jgi:hypothetical protein
MMFAVTVRRIKPGAYEAFRQAWEPEPWPPQLQRVLVARNDQDQDQVLTASFFDLQPEELEAARDDPSILGAEGERLQRIAAHVDSVVFKGVFEVAEELSPPD